MTAAIHNVYCGIMADHEHPNEKDRDQARQMIAAIGAEPGRQRTTTARPGGVSEAVCKPSSVLSRLAADRDGHPSGAAGRPTAHAADPRAGQRTSPPSTVARRRVAPSYLALLRVEFARFTPVVGLRRSSGIVTVALVLASRRAGVTRHPALRSSDFPHAARRVAPSPTRSHPTASLTEAMLPARSRPETRGQVGIADEDRPDPPVPSMTRRPSRQSVVAVVAAVIAWVNRPSTSPIGPMQPMIVIRSSPMATPPSA